MYQKSPIQPMHMQGQPRYIPYPNYSMPPPPPAPKKKGLLAKLFQKNDPAAPFMHMVPSYRQVGQQSHIPYQQYPQYMQGQGQGQPQMMPRQSQAAGPQMMSQNETRGGAEGASGGIGTFFSNLISNPTGMLNNVEKVVQVAQSVGPVVEQYSPIVRSIPNLVKIFTSRSSSSEEQAETESETGTENTVEIHEKPPEEKVSLIPYSKPSVKKKKMKKEPVIEKEIQEEKIIFTTPKPKLYV